MEEWFDVTSAFESCTRRVSYQGLYEVVSDDSIAPEKDGYLYERTEFNGFRYVHHYRHIDRQASNNGNLLGTTAISS